MGRQVLRVGETGFGGWGVCVWGLDKAAFDGRRVKEDRKQEPV